MIGNMVMNSEHVMIKLEHVYSVNVELFEPALSAFQIYLAILCFYNTQHRNSLYHASIVNSAGLIFE